MTNIIKSNTVVQSGQKTTLDFALVPIPTVAQNDRKIILIKGTANLSNFDPLIQKLKSELGYKDDNILVCTFSDDVPGHLAGFASIEVAVRQLHAKILARKIAKWGGQNAKVEVNIIAHSAGGLLARYFINKANIVSSPGQNFPSNVRPLVKVRNLLTLGTPEGGIFAVSVF